MPCTDSDASPLGEAVERQDRADEDEDGGAGDDRRAGQARSHQIGCFELARARGEVARQRHQFGGDPAQAGIGKARGDALLQALGRVDDQRGIERPVVHVALAGAPRIMLSAGALVRSP